MGTYTLTFKDGSTIDVEAPPNTPQPELMRRARLQLRAQQEGPAQELYRRSAERLSELGRQRAELEATQPIPRERDEETGVVGDLLSGFGAGAVGVGEYAALGAATLLDEEEELVARDRIQNIAEAIRPDSGDPEDLAYKVGSVFGSIAGVAGAGAAATYGAAAAGLGAVGAGIAGLLGAGAIGVGAGAGEASERAREFGATEEERAAATRRGAAIGATEIIPLGRVLGPVARRLTGDLGEEAVQTIRQRLVRAARTGGEEALQEAGANILQNLNERGYNAEQAILEGAGEAGALGGGAGAALQLFVDTFVGRRAGRGQPPEAIPETGPAPEPTLPAPEETLALPAPEPTPTEEMAVTPEGQALSREQRIAREEQRVQAEARDREALRAAERGDEAAFEQPDLFALEMEQERRRLGEQPTMPEAAPEPTPVATPEAATGQRDFIDELNEIEQLDRMQAEEDAQRAEQERVRAESELETLGAAEVTRRQKATEQTRRGILQDVIEKTPSRNYGRVSRAYTQALQEAGLRDTQPTDAERQTIERAVNVQRAERPAPPQPERAEPIESPPEATQLQEMESRIPEAEMDLFGRRRVARQPAQQEPAPEPQPITRQVLDDMGIPASARIRNQVMNRDLTDPATRKKIVDFANSRSASQTTRLKVSRYLEGVPEAQPDLFTPRGVRRTAPQPTQEARNDLERPITGGDRTSVPSGGGRMGERGRPVRPAGDTGGVAAPRGRGLGGDLPSIERAAIPTGAQPRTLTVGQQPEARPEAEPVEARQPRPARGEQPQRPTRPQPQQRPQRQPEPRPTQTKAAVEAKLMDAYDANTTEDAKRYVKGLKVEVAVDPMTVADKEKVLEVVNTKLNGKNKNKLGPIVRYLSSYEDPILGLQDAIDDVVSGTPQFRNDDKADWTQQEIAFFGPQGLMPGKGKQTAQKVLDWASENMSEATKRWMANTIKEAKLRDANIAAFESTDLVAKRREIEKLLEGGFDITDAADAKALNELMEKLGIDETDPMLRNALYKGGMMNLKAPAASLPLSNVVVGALRGGNLGAALRALAATNSDPETARVAGKLANVVGDTKVNVVPTLRDAKGEEVAGTFDSESNTVTLSAKLGLNGHTLLHEMTHAATVATLGKKNHPLTRKLDKIYQQAKEYLPSAYGSQNLQEFVAEAFSNPEFQQALKSLRVDGEPLTTFAKVKAAISNFLRSLIGAKVKPVESALTESQSIIDNILAPAPDKVDSAELFMLKPREAGLRVAEMLDGMQKSVGPLTDKFRERFGDQLNEFLRGKLPDTRKRLAMGLLPSQAFADVARKNGLTGMYELHKLMEEQRGAVAKADAKVEGVLKSVSNWVRSNPAKEEVLNRVVYKSTIEQVDPSKARAYYEKVGDPDKLKAYDEMRRDWGKLGSDGRKIYEQMRDTYKRQYEEMRNVIYGKIDETISDEAARKQLKNEVYARLFETGTIEPYFPLTRSGNYWLSYVADGEFTVEAFETLSERERAINDLKNTEGVSDVEKFVNLSNANFTKAPPSSFVGQTLQTLRANKVDDKVQAEILRLFVEALPETSFAKSLQRRKGTAGYKEDSIYALKTKAFDLGRQIERLRYSAKIRDLQDKIMEDNANKITDENKYLVDEMMKRADFARNPPPDGAAQAANRVAFIWTIGFNASSAVVNLSQVPLFVYPMLGGKYGYDKATTAISTASKLVTSSGLSRKIPMVAPFGNDNTVKGMAMPGLDNYFEIDASGDYVVRNDIDLDPETRAEVEKIKPLVEMMAARGQLNRSLFADSLGLDMSGRERGVTDLISNASAFMFHNVEMFNRQVTALSAYQLELARLESTAEGQAMSTAERQQAAAEQALYETQQTNGGAVLETAPRFAQQGIGRVALMYKSYGLQMYYTMFKTTKQMLNAQADPEARKIAARQMAGVFGSSFLLAGAVGMPLARELMQLMNLFLLDDDEEDAETLVRKAIGETMYKGPLTALLGVDLSSRIGLSGLILQANRFNSNASLEEDFLYYFGGPAWSTVASMHRGYQDLMQGNTIRGVESMVPGAVRNAIRSLYRYPADDGILTRRGDPITDDLSFTDLAAQFIGFAPAEYTRTQEMNQVTKRIDRAVNSDRTNLLRRLYVTTRMGDSGGRDAVIEQIREFNRRHPSARITGDSVRRSMRRHMETSATMYNGITISPNMRRALEQQRAEWDQGFQLF